MEVDKISIPPLLLVAVRKIRNHRFTRGAGSRVSATHINRFARRTAWKRWLTDGKGGGGGARVSVCKEFVPSMPQTFAINHRFHIPLPPGSKPSTNPLPLRASEFTRVQRHGRSLTHEPRSCVSIGQLCAFVRHLLSADISCILEQREGDNRIDNNRSCALV